MKKKFLLTFFILICLGIYYQARQNYAHSNSFGAPFISGRGYTNSPFDGRACNTSGCHSGTLNSGPGSVEITTDIPDHGYKAGNIYNVTVTVSQSGIKKFGFQMTSEDEFDNKSGKFIANSLTRAPSDFYITHGTSSASSSGIDTKSWSFMWIAPTPKGDGPITFYAAFNAANSNNASSGDRIYTTHITVDESIYSGISKQQQISSLVTYPNPASGKCQLTITLNKNIENLIYTIFTMNGKIVKQKSISPVGRQISEPVFLNELPSGCYIIKVQTAEESLARKLIIHH